LCEVDLGWFQGKRNGEQQQMQQPRHVQHQMPVALQQVDRRACSSTELRGRWCANVGCSAEEAVLSAFVGKKEQAAAAAVNVHLSWLAALLPLFMTHVCSSVLCSFCVLAQVCILHFSPLLLQRTLLSATQSSTSKPKLTIGQVS
jgi:hypothetical protein